MNKILFIHQSAELYGSDKTLLSLLQNLDKNRFFPVVVLPSNGPLKRELEKNNIIVEIAPVLKLYRDLIKPKNFVSFFNDIKTGFKIINQLQKRHQFDLVYSNTLAVLLGVMFAWRKSIPHIWHVHEIIEKPSFFKKGFIKLLSLKKNKAIIFNSKATQKFWSQNKQIESKGSVVWNGIESNFGKRSYVEISILRNNLFKSNENEIVIGLVGRISRWKGQLLLLEAFKTLQLKYENLKLVFVGDAPPNQNHFKKNLEVQIKQNNLQKKILIIPFQEDIEIIWQSIDIAVVPSTEPEPFGMVAIEAMNASKPIVGANHGGLQEIIIHNETGFLFEPNNENDLIESLERLILNQDLRTNFGRKGKIRANEFFTDKSYSNRIEEIILSQISF